MVRLILRDPATGIGVTWEGEEQVTVDMKTAVAALANKIVEEAGIPIHEVLFSNQPFEIAAENV